MKFIISIRKRILLAPVLFYLFFSVCSLSSPASNPSFPSDSSVNLEMGNPSKAGTNANNYLQDEIYFTLSYNNQMGEPNWVSWRVTSADLGTAPRYKFHTDTFLPSSFNLVSTSDYANSGFDRGHMCDHSDRAANEASSMATFTMANIIPQSPRLNQVTWEHLEAYCRDLVAQGNTIYQMCGPSGSGGDGSKGQASEIGDRHKVTVPEKCWKVIMVIPGDGSTNDCSKVTSSTRLIAVIMPNSQSVSGDWKSYRVSVDAVEKLTGYTFFDKVNPKVIVPLKAKVDNQ